MIEIYWVITGGSIDILLMKAEVCLLVDDCIRLDRDHHILGVISTIVAHLSVPGSVIKRGKDRDHHTHGDKLITMTLFEFVAFRNQPFVYPAV